MANSSQSVIQDVNSVYYIHPSENPTVSLVSEKFNGDNYADWKKGMILAFSMKNKLVFIDGSLTKPDSGDPMFNAWERCNNMVISYLLRSMDNTLSKSVMFFATAEEIWKDLEDRYSIISGPQFYSLQQSLNQISQGNTSVSEFFTKIKGMWDQISAARPIPVCTCNGCSCNLIKNFFKSQQDERLIHFLMKLDNRYAAVRTNFLMMNPLPTISATYNLLVQDERKKEVSEVYKQHSAMVFLAADEKKMDHLGQHKQQFTGNTSRFLYRRNTTMYCDHCKMPGHTMDRCYKIHGYPPKYGYGKGGKNKRIAAVVYGDKDTDEEDQNTTHLTKAQYDQFVNFMKQNK
ncbi:uncharacterized protein LOC110735604 [Chenopodium quinoa]|uniref:uncharacterized protein LOC110735604 n=1 Tax=Chenopodium quinoa TaxID=63459 RepID=UPI000B798E2A|nr:uncharacterized protein LOC110735604 [Chenopodium quinoa]